MFELSLGNWIPVCRFLMRILGEWYGVLIVVYKFVVGFGVVRVISSIFLHETLRTAASDDALMILDKKRLRRKHATKMTRFLKKADTSQDGRLSRSEFKTMFRNQDIRAWFQAQGIDTDDADLIFNLLEDSGNSLSEEEWIAGISRLKGTARSVDVLTCMHMLSQVI